MGGINPYIEQSDIPKPSKKYQVTFLIEDKSQTVEVDPAGIPFQDNGLPGSILDIALHHDIHIDHACGGVVACSTCHVKVKQGLNSCNPASDDELDQLDNAPNTSTISRLSCQTVANGSEDLIVEIPKWNRNRVSEDPHVGK